MSFHDEGVICKFTRRSQEYGINVSSAIINEDSAQITSFEGKHEEGKSNDDVVELVFDKTRVEYFPKKLTFFFPRLSSLHINNCLLKEISRQDLVGLALLSELIKNYWLLVENAA